MRALLLLGLLAGCTSNDACAGLGTCLALDVKGTLKISDLDIQVSGEVNGTRLVPTKPKDATLPQTVALEFNPPGGFNGMFGFQINVTALLNAAPVGFGSLSATMTVGQHSSATLFVSPGAPLNMDLLGKEPADLGRDMAKPFDLF
jgi:hypothetical protein